MLMILDAYYLMVLKAPAEAIRPEHPFKFYICNLI